MPRPHCLVPPASRLTLASRLTRLCAAGSCAELSKAVEHDACCDVCTDITAASSGGDMQLAKDTCVQKPGAWTWVVGMECVDQFLLRAPPLRLRFDYLTVLYNTASTPTQV